MTTMAKAKAKPKPKPKRPLNSSSSSSSLGRLWPLSSAVFIPRGGDSLFYLIALLSILSLLLHHLSASLVSASSHFEGFDADDEDSLLDDPLSDLPVRSPPPPTSSLSHPAESHHTPPPDPIPPPAADSSTPSSDLASKPPLSTSFEYWDEDEFEGLPLPVEQPPSEPSNFGTENATAPESKTIPYLRSSTENPKPKSFTIEIVCGSFFIMLAINFFTGKTENENIALAWSKKFASKDSIFEKNFSLLGIGDGEDAPLLLREGRNVFKFYASGRRYCQGLLATMELKNRHDLISRLFNLVVPAKDEITFEVFMNEDGMDQVVLAVARKKEAKAMHKDFPDLQKFANSMSPPSGRKWVAEDLAVVSESKEVAGDLIPEAVLDQVFGEKAFEKFGKYFISMHFSDQHSGRYRKLLVFRFILPDVNNMADMTRLVALVPYYIDLIGRYKLNSQVRSRTEAVRLKATQEEYKELQNARQEALQRKKAERRKIMEEAEAKLSAEALRKKEAKDRTRQMKKAMPRMKMTRAH